MYTEEMARGWFKDHVATFANYGNIKVVDFVNPDEAESRIRFLFEEDFKRLIITGDTVELVMADYFLRFDTFDKYANDIERFKKGILIINKPLYTYNSESKMENDIMDYILRNGFLHDVAHQLRGDHNSTLTDEQVVKSEFMSDLLYYWEPYRDIGIGFYGYTKLLQNGVDVSLEDVEKFGAEETGILDVCACAWKMAMEQLRGKNND